MPIAIVTWLKNKKEGKALFEEGWAFENNSQFKEALECYSQAHEREHLISTFLLSIHYQRGEWVDENNELAEKYLSMGQSEG